MIADRHEKQGFMFAEKDVCQRGIYIYPLLANMANILFAAHSPRGNPMFPVFAVMVISANIEN